MAFVSRCAPPPSRCAENAFLVPTLILAVIVPHRFCDGVGTRGGSAIIPIDVELCPTQALNAEELVLSREIVHIPDATSLRLIFDSSIENGLPADKSVQLRITSLLDGAVQHLNVDSIEQWGYTSAYFNGDAVRIELIGESDGVCVARCIGVMAGPFVDPFPESICGLEDDRVLSFDPRIGRAQPQTCSAWIIDDANGCLLSAGHCADNMPGPFEVIEFNVPLSTSSGDEQHPGPEDQYAVDPDSIQFTFANSGFEVFGQDWSYFGCFPNTETGLLPREAQGGAIDLAAELPARTGGDVRLTGFGTVTPPVPLEWDTAQKTNVGPANLLSDTQVSYSLDTSPGDSGSPLLLESSDAAIAIHTSGVCEVDRLGNAGTSIAHPGLRAAFAFPRGMCQPPIRFEFPNGIPVRINPAGDTLEVNIASSDGTELDPDSPMMHYRIASDFVKVPLIERGAGQYEAPLSALPEGTDLHFFFTAHTIDGAPVMQPAEYARATYHTIATTEPVLRTFNDRVSFLLAIEGMDSQIESFDGYELGTIIPENGELGGFTYSNWPTAFGDGGIIVENEVALGTQSLGLEPNGDGLGGQNKFSAGDEFDIAFNDSINAVGISFAIPVQIDLFDALFIATDVGTVSEGSDGTPEPQRFIGMLSTEPFSSAQIGSIFDPPPFFTYTVDDLIVARLPGPGCPADLNGDGEIGFADLLALLASWGRCMACPADLDASGEVSFSDLLALLASWGGCD